MVEEVWRMVAVIARMGTLETFVNTLPIVRGMRTARMEENALQSRTVWWSSPATVPMGSLDRTVDKVSEEIDIETERDRYGVDYREVRQNKMFKEMS